MNHLSLEIKNKNFRDLYLCYCGKHICESSYSFGPAVRPNYLLHFILDGKGSYYLNNKKYELEKNQCFLIRPNDVTFYQADKDNPWTYIWVGFDGDMAENYLEYAGFDKYTDVLDYKNFEGLESYIQEMLNHNTISHSNELKINGLLYLLLSNLSESSNKPYTSNNNEDYDNLYISKSIEFIQNNYHNYIKVNDIANYLCLNRTYLTSLFHKHLGMSPQNFLIQFRITKASDLLADTDLPVGNIARSCGYTDPLAFSKTFKKVKGYTPTQYREFKSKKA